MPDTAPACIITKPTAASPATICLVGALVASNAGTVGRDLDRIMRKTRVDRLRLDLAGLTRLDDFGVAVLARLKKKSTNPDSRQHLDLTGMRPEVAAVLALHHFDTLSQPLATIPTRSPFPGVLETFGAAGIRAGKDTLYLLTFLGSTAFCLLRIFRNPRQLRWNDTLSSMQRTGVNAFPIVALISFLLGLIMAFMSSVQLQQFGANIYVASLVSLSMARELGPIMTAIIVAGRSGSAYAAEIGSMRISEEIDALFTMGFDPHLFLVMPKLIATVLVMPMLVLFSDVFAMAGGLLIGTTMLDLTLNGYVNQTIATLDLFDVFWGVGKSIIFALIIAWIGCLRGFRVRGGADAVGRATTSAVVSAIFLIVLADSVFAVILRYWE